MATNNKIYTCPSCGSGFATKEALVDHTNATHNKTNSYTSISQTSTTEGTVNTIETTAMLYDTSGGSMTITNCIPVSKRTTKIESAHSVVTSTDIKASKHKAIQIDPKETVLNPKDVIQQNQNSYPPVVGTTPTGRYKYNYEIDMQQTILESIQRVKENLNIPSAYSRLELNKLFHEKFNRFRIQYPDYFLNGTVAYVVMTRPDLNLFKDDSNLTYSNIQTQVLNDPQLYYIMNADLETAKTLTKGFSSHHHFNPLLSNTLTSLDISDESIDTLETGETFTGFKTQYAKSNIRSMTAGTISLKFPETYNMALTHAHQLWCTYESCVYRGSMEPKEKYIWNKELDYACDIYYFLLDKQDMIIRYWCKYTGCFPLNVNKSVFSYDAGSELNHPELSVTYAYFAREDMSSITINEFNNNGGGVNSGFRYKANYIPSIDAQGNTWANAPFVEAITQPTGMGRTAKLYALRFRD